MSQLLTDLKRLADDLTTQEAAVCVDGQAVLYSKIESTGDGFNWLSKTGHSPALVALQQNQLATGSQSRACVLALTDALIRSLM